MSPILSPPRSSSRYTAIASITDAVANPLYQRVLECRQCPICWYDTPVPGVGDAKAASIMVVLEAPAENELRYKVPVTGATWEALEVYLRLAGLSRDTIWLTNTVKGRPQSDPEWRDADVCFPLWFYEELRLVRPRVIVACGQLAIRRILDAPKATVEEVHGRVYDATWDLGEDQRHSAYVLPTYHPAAGFYSPQVIRHLRDDFTLLGRIKSGDAEAIAQSRPPRDRYHGCENYQRRPLDAGDYVAIQEQGWVAVDTEVVNGQLWCASFSWYAGSGVQVMRADLDSALPVFDGSLGVRVLMHNAPYDVPQIRSCGYPFDAGLLEDSLYKARMLQLESAGLKQLAVRLLGAEMQEYGSVVESGQGSQWQERLARYLLSAYRLSCDLPDPPRALESVWDKNAHCLVSRLRKPQRLDRKLIRLHKDWLDGRVAATAEANGKTLSQALLERWKSWGGTEELESFLGPFPVASLADADPQVALRYSARDADMTGRIHPILDRMLADAGLTEVCRTDTESLPLVLEMAVNGIAVDAEYFKALSVDLSAQMLAIEGQLPNLYPDGWSHIINPGSDDQVAWLLFEHLGLPVYKRTKVRGEASTDDAVLARAARLHPAVPLILEYRKLLKAKSVYCEAMPSHADASGRVHCDLSGTTVSGRLATKEPNLVAVDNSPEIRKGLVARL